MVSMVETLWARMVAGMMSETGEEQEPVVGFRSVWEA